MMLYVSLEQEKAVKTLFTNKGWGFKKPGNSVDLIWLVTADAYNFRNGIIIGDAHWQKKFLQLSNASHMSLIMRKPVYGVSNQVRHKRPQKMARDVKFPI